MSFFRRKLYIIICFLSFFIIGSVAAIDSIRPVDTITLNTKSKIKLDDFFDGTTWDASFITNVNNIDTKIPGTYNIKIKVNSSIYNSTLKIIDQNAPILEVKDVIMGYYEEVKPELFVVKVEDESNYTISFDHEFKKQMGEQTVTIVARDTAGNVTKKKATLVLEKVKEKIELEAGTNFKFKDVLYGADKIKDKKIIKNINNKKLGEQDLIIEVEGDKYTIKVNVKDTVAPKVVTKNVTIWWDQKVSSIDKFLKKISDATSVKKEYLKDIDYQKIGTQEVKIRVTDAAGNKSDTTAKLTIKKDTVGPKIKNLSTINVIRGKSINCSRGVTASDDHDGKVQVSCSSINASKPGTYYSTCTAKDKSGNVTKKKRKIIVTGNADDVINKLKPVANSLKKGSKQATALTIRTWVRNNLTYSARYNSRDTYIAAWNGLTIHKGDCFTYYALSKVLLDLCNIENKLIYSKNHDHYWNLVHVEIGWRHLDGTFKNTNKLMTDSEFAKATAKSWDKNKWPKVS